MKRMHTVGSAAVVVGAFLATLSAMPAASTTSEWAVSHEAPEQSEVLEYWTAERMNAASPFEGGFLDGGGVPGEALSADSARDELGSPWTDGGLIAKTAGKVFFTVQQDGETYDVSCSGNVVESENGDVVMTAKHCSAGSRYVFAPGYDQGAIPYGVWPVARIVTDGRPDLQNDFAALVTEEVNGESLQDIVGGQGIAFDGEPTRLAVFGYPSVRANAPDRPYSGEELIYSEGPAVRQGHRIGAGSDMASGASGGPLLTDFDESSGRGVQRAVVSGSRCLTPSCDVLEEIISGTAFDDVARAVYDEAANS